MQNTGTPLVELSHIHLEFGQRKVLNDVSLKIYRGEFVVLHGDTGCGKSSVLHLIAGILKPTSGNVLLEGEDIQKFTDMQRCWVRQKIGFMLQSSVLLEDRTILDNVMLPALASEMSISEARNAAHAAMQLCDIAEAAHKMPSELSSGQRQKACLARAIINQPRLILADEPAAHLDAANAQALINLLGAISTMEDGPVVILATHLKLVPNDVSYREVRFANTAGGMP